MAFGETYRKQVALLVRILPLIAEEPCFALKGGTAINLFLTIPAVTTKASIRFAQPYSGTGTTKSDGACLHLRARKRHAKPRII
jgi:hypothetical protein